MENPVVSNPNDFKVVEFYNKTDFDFTPELGAMFDGRPLFVGSGEKRQFPYHIGRRLAVNLAKAVLIKGAPLHDPNANNPVGTPLWGDEKVKALEDSFITELYADEKPVALTEVDKLFAKVKELEALIKDKKEPVKSIQELVAPELIPSPITPEVAAVKPVEPSLEAPKVYQDKQEVIAELEKRGIKHDKRSSKESLIKLLV